MAEISKSGTPSMCTPSPPSNCRIPSLTAGEDIAAADACYIKSDGKAWKATGAAANAAAKIAGFAFVAAKTGQPVDLYHDVNFNYGSGLTPGAEYFLSGSTAGGLADAASTGGTKVIAIAVNDKVIRVLLNR